MTRPEIIKELAKYGVKEADIKRSEGKGKPLIKDFRDKLEKLLSKGSDTSFSKRQSTGETIRRTSSSRRNC